MKLDISKGELVHLISSCYAPDYSQMEDDLIKSLGEFNGSHSYWAWNKKALLELTESELLKLRELFKASK